MNRAEANASIKDITVQYESFEPDIEANTYLYFYSLDLSPYLLSFKAWTIDGHRPEYNLAIWFDFSVNLAIDEMLRAIYKAPAPGRLAFISPKLCYFWRWCAWDYVREDYYRDGYIRLNFWQTHIHRGEHFYGR